METCRVGAGPVTSGPNVQRKDPIIQRSFYNGWKSVHGLKHQTVEAALGLCVHIWGPVSLRRNDRHLLRESKIHEQIKSLSTLYSIFGDSIYPIDTNISSYLHTDSDMAELYNSIMKKIRISIEWNYGLTYNLFRYLNMNYKMFVLNHSIMKKIFIVCTLLRNFHVILYGSETSSYFNYSFSADFLKSYINQSEL